jgi:subtilisin family serine protease
MQKKFSYFFSILSIGLLCYVPFSQLSYLFAQEKVVGPPSANAANSKIGGLLFLQMKMKKDYTTNPREHLLRAMRIHGMQTQNLEKQKVFIHFPVKPSGNEIKDLGALGIKLFENSWIPPLKNHPTGFILAQAPLDVLSLVAEKAYITRIATAERTSLPLNDFATGIAFGIHASEVWDMGFEGTDITMAVLDSGLDLDHPDLPDPAEIQSKDYSRYPALDDTVSNAQTATIHGTHVTGSVVGRGTQSSGKYKGSAPSANLVFLKIGNDSPGAPADNPAIIGAFKDAVGVYGADIITMSYGNSSTYHDGSDELCQAVDYAVDQGAAVFIAAGNEGDNEEHYFGTAPANGSTDFIRIDATGIQSSNSHALLYNLVWDDGTGMSVDLELEFYNAGKNSLLTSSSDQHEGLRGTESQFFYYGKDSPQMIPAGSSTYFIKVQNNSSISQDFHIYYNYLYNPGEIVDHKITFAEPDLYYNVTSPAEADGAIAIGAYVSRKTWTNYEGKTYSFPSTASVGELAIFSSHGPRVDGMMKPNIIAPGSAIVSLNDLDVGSPKMYVLDPYPYYAVNRGTSMACPLAAGAAALLLQQDQALSPADLKDILEETATLDQFTGIVPNGKWGYGKLNIEEAFLAVGIGTFPTTGAIKGSASDAQTGEPLANVLIILTPGDITTITDNNGEYHFTDISEGTYTISVFADLYRDESKTITVTPGTTVTINFQLTPITQNSPPLSAPIPAMGQKVCPSF